MNKLVFLAPFPTKENIKDGMISRVDAIDSAVKDVERIYLNVSLFKHWQMSVTLSEKVTAYSMNIFRHYLKINRILKQANTIYAHSIYMFAYLWQILPFLKARIILDAHGVVPEEERYFVHHKYRYLYYEFLEKKILKKVSCIVCVTSSMRRHFILKYPNYKGTFCIYNIFPKNIKISMVNGKPFGVVNVIYSGGVSPWQNIDLMLKIIAKNISPRIKYIILTSDTDYVTTRMDYFGINHADIELKSVLPDELVPYYEKADYAFILRDDNIVNQVACPTKLVEYLNYGMIPIVLSPYIGDFYEYGYEHLLSDYFNRDIEKPTKSSLINMNIVKRMAENNDRVNIRALILSKNV